MALSDDEFEALVQQLQQNSFADARDAHGDKGFERWRNPRYHEPLAEPDGSSFLRGSCGDSIGISLTFDDNRVKQAAYRTDGCASSALCSSFTAELAVGKPPEELFALTADDVLEAIGRFPREDRHAQRWPSRRCNTRPKNTSIAGRCRPPKRSSRSGPDSSERAVTVHRRHHR
jgi:nitrogen fixation NifU-like protein